MAAVLLLISSRILQDGTAICLILCDLYYVLVYLSMLRHISSGVQITDVQETLGPFCVFFILQFDPRLISFFSDPQRTNPKGHLFPAPDLDVTVRPHALGLN